MINLLLSNLLYVFDVNIDMGAVHYNNVQRLLYLRKLFTFG